MPDITMCANKKCPLKKTCYRYTATPSKFMQSYAGFEYDKDTKSCDYYVKNVKNGKDNTGV